MKLIENVSRVYNGKEYKKYSVVIPTPLIEKLNWKPGEELEVDIKNNKLVIFTNTLPQGNKKNV